MFSPIRFIQIGIAVYGHLFWWVLVRAGLWRSHLTPAQKFSGTLEKLGTPFVKLGQGLSMHTEFLPDDYVAALTSLQDHVAPRLRRLDPLGLVEEVLRNLRKEMDFRQEARNIRRFTEIFKDSPTIFVPAAIEGMQTEWISVQHMSGGYRIDDAGLKESGPMLAQAFVDAYLKQFFSVGVFHGDPHPANLFIMQDGRICFHDFGLVGFLDHSTRRILAAFMRAFVLMDGLLAKAPAFAGEAMSEGGNDSGMQRLKYEAAVAFRQIPDGLSSLVRKARAGILGIRLNHHGLENLERQIERASRRVALSLVTLGLYIAASLLMQHSIGPRIFDFPLLAALGYGLALWLTFHLIKGARNIEES